MGSLHLEFLRDHGSTRVTGATLPQAVPETPLEIRCTDVRPVPGSLERRAVPGCHVLNSNKRMGRDLFSSVMFFPFLFAS